MVELILPPRLRSASHPFADLCNKPADLQVVAHSVATSLARSFKDDAARHDGLFITHTAAEERRRAEILFKWFRRLRGDLGYSLSMALDELPRALRAELDGTPYEPPPKGRSRGVEGVLA